MRTILAVLTCLTLLTSGSLVAQGDPPMSSIYDFALTDIDGNDVPLAQYRGQVVMIVNVASKCGFTKQYKGLQELYDKYKDRGFVILGFPANNFMGQEPGSEEDIKAFCTTTFGVSFPMFSKISVKGDDQHPLYRYLTEKETNPEFAGKITWNFNKFLIGRDGKIVDRFGSMDSPESGKVVEAIEAALTTPSRVPSFVLTPSDASPPE